MECVFSGSFGSKLKLNFPLFPFSVRHPHTHSHFYHRHTTCLCHILGGCLASRCSSLTSPSVCWLSMASVKSKSGAVLLHCRNTDGLMKPPTQPGHCLKGRASNSLPSGVTQVEKVSRQPQRSHRHCHFCFILLFALTQLIYWQTIVWFLGSDLPLTTINQGHHSICSGVAIQI